ncbi:MAG: NAD-dependent epimerase/dehydratase family protein [Candidatus Bathyarchaeia archaeon]|nr:NAD-dependent epimerase/dehydratase family protein [Candidatus Bathyarchaeota archaeon]MCR8486939.1 NAD-dependent epimerase/dehydratase family protein [Thermoproteota archaeon]
MKVLVTGGAGFIGSHVAEYYASKGDEVVIMDNFSRHVLLGKGEEWQRYNLEYLRRNHPSITVIEGDVRRMEDLNKVGRSVDIIIHAAAQVAVTTSLVDPLTDFTINTLATLNVLEFARRNDSFVLFCSTNKVYGENVNKIPLKDLGTRYWYAEPIYEEGIPEEFPVDGCAHTPYGCSKLSADIYVQDYAYTYGLRTIVFRLSCIYGERQFGVEDQGWLAHFIKQAILDEWITIYGDGKQVRDVLYVKDLVNAINLGFINSKRIRGEVFNIGGGPENAISILEGLAYIRELVGHDLRIRYADWRKADQKVYVSRIKKAYDLLHWKPSVSWREGIKKLYIWMEDLLRKR